MRRVIRGEQVPGSEKVIPFFECHPDVIVQGGRDTRCGHKVFLHGGPSGLVLDCVIARGNPADAVMLPTFSLPDHGRSLPRERAYQTKM